MSSSADQSADAHPYMHTRVHAPHRFKNRRGRKTKAHVPSHAPGAAAGAGRAANASFSGEWRTGFVELVVQLVVPALAALLAIAAIHLTGDEGPLLHAVLAYELLEALILLRLPRLAEVGIGRATIARWRFAAREGYAQMAKARASRQQRALCARKPVCALGPANKHVATADGGHDSEERIDLRHGAAGTHPLMLTVAERDASSPSARTKRRALSASVSFRRARGLEHLASASRVRFNFIWELRSASKA